jgi:mannose-1-phosphate guanylyltransferase/mannose-6-phosphate isomerase
VVETPDSILVSDLDRSRDVKYIAALLREKGRREYHQHRTLHFPWGTQTVFEQAAEVTVSRLMVYPAATMQTAIGVRGTVHLAVLQGVAVVQTGQSKNVFKQGAVATVKGKDRLRVENAADRPLHLIQVQMVASEPQ